MDIKLVLFNITFTTENILKKPKQTYAKNYVPSSH